MPRNITVTFADGTSHVYENAPDNITPDTVTARAQQEFGKSVTGLDGGRQAASGEIPLGRKIREVVGPTVEMLGGIGGGALGAAGGTVLGGPVGGTVGAVAGAGIGTGISKELLNYVDTAMGWKKPREGAQQVTEPVKNVLEGAAYESLGRSMGEVFGRGVKWWEGRPRQQAIKILKESYNLPPEEINKILNQAPEGFTASQALTTQKLPTTQALLKSAESRLPEFYGETGSTLSAGKGAAGVPSAQYDVGAQTLNRLAGGQTAADVRGTTEVAKSNINALTTPMRESALNRANLGKEVARLEAMSSELGEQAAAKVQEVRKLMELGDLSAANARLNLIKQNLPVGLTKYTYGGELAEKAFGEWSNKAATASLDLGQGARFAKDAATALRSAGIKPLEGESLVRSLKSVTNNPEFAGNDVLLGALQNVSDDIAKWTGSGGVIDARALDAIRKNSVNAAIQKLRPGLDATSQRNLAAGVLSKVRPAIDDAIEAAGGTGYREYLKEHARLSQQLAEKQLSGEALRLYKTNPQGFVDLVKNESPDVVEKFLGPGKYNIAQELSDAATESLKKTAAPIEAGAVASAQAAEGQTALRGLLEANVSRFRLPWKLSYKTAAINQAVSIAEKALGSKTMMEIAKAGRNADDMKTLLANLKPSDRVKVENFINNPTLWKLSPSGVVGQEMYGVSNALVPDRERSNALAH